LLCQKLGVNITTADLHAGDLLDKIAATFGKNDVPLNLITLEINESVYGLPVFEGRRPRATAVLLRRHAEGAIGVTPMMIDRSVRLADTRKPLVA
jgi:hypothetical protein